MKILQYQKSYTTLRPMHHHKVWKNIFTMVAIAFLMVIRNFSLVLEILLMKSIKFADVSKPVIDVSELTMVKKNASTHRVMFIYTQNFISRGFIWSSGPEVPGTISLVWASMAYREYSQRF